MAHSAGSRPPRGRLGLREDPHLFRGDAAGSGGRFALARYNPDGTLDTSFGGDGRVTINFTRGGDFAYSVALQMDGKIVAAGAAEVPEAASRWHGTTMTAVSTRASAATAGDD